MIPGKRVTQADINKEKIKAQRESQVNRKEMQLNKFTDEEVLVDLKAKGLPTFGTKQEKIDRLKKYYGIQITKNEEIPIPPIKQPLPAAIVAPQDNQIKKPLPKSNVVDEIEKMKQKRDERRQKMENHKKEKAEKEAEVQASGKNIDVDFELMIEKHRFKENILHPHVSAAHLKLCICVRKRPIFKKEEIAGEMDSVSCANPQIKVLESKLKVDGITKYIEDHSFTFDNTFNENETHEDLYNYTLNPLVDLIFNGGVVTCFAYGQTGSGKTYTMVGVQELVLNDIYVYANKKYASLNPSFYISFFEIYGGRCYDLLNNKNKLNILEDKNNNVKVQGLVERAANNPQEMFSLIQYGNSVRTTHATSANDTSSRSHAICIVGVRTSRNDNAGKLILVDLAGSERAQDTQSNNRQRRLEGAEINKSLLALKECIRAMDSNANHIPFRASKLTLVLRDSFLSTSTNGRIVMIACVCPGSSSADHTLNTLRYADRLKDRTNDPKPSEIPLPIRKEEALIENKKFENIPENNKKYDGASNNNENKAHNNGNNNNNNYGNYSNNNANYNNKNGFQKIEKKENNGRGSKQEIKYESNKDIQSLNNIPIKSDHSSEEEKDDERILDDGEIVKENQNKFKEDLKCMKETMKLDDNNKKVSNEFFDFHEKVNKILEEQEEIFSIHMAAIKEDAKLLTQESELISEVQTIGFMDYDIDNYVETLDSVLKKKFKIYNLLNKKLEKFKKYLKEEEEISSKVKGTLYY